MQENSGSGIIGAIGTPIIFILFGVVLLFIGFVIPNVFGFSTYFIIGGVVAIIAGVVNLFFMRQQT